MDVFTLARQSIIGEPGAVMKGNSMNLSFRFDQALQYATLIHAGQTRKGTEIPYLAHLLAVTSLVLEYGGNEDEAIAALLHDAGEDAGGRGRIEDIRIRFGEPVAAIVEACTDAVTHPKPPWRQRKEDYIAHLAKASPSARLVSLCDKLHNASSIARDYRRHGESLWDRFNGKRDGTLWYYRALVNGFRQAGTSPLVEELDRVVTDMEDTAAGNKP